MAPANVKAAALFCRNKFFGTAVDMGFERGLVVEYATGWDMDDEKQMDEVERRVRDEEPVLLIVSPVCRAFSTLIELTRATGKLSEVEYRNLGERCVRHFSFCVRICETQRRPGRLFLHAHPWDAWSRGLSFVKELAERWCVQDEG